MMNQLMPVWQIYQRTQSLQVFFLILRIPSFSSKGRSLEIQFASHCKLRQDDFRQFKERSLPNVGY